MNHSINFFRFVFTIIIAFSHCAVLSRWLPSGHIVVEFFFIVSGYFLYHHCTKYKEGVISYTKKRFYKFWLKAVLISLILNLMNLKYLLSFDFTDTIRHFTRESLLLYQIIPLNDVIKISNNPVWYLSVLIYGGAFIYAIIKTFPKLHKTTILLLAFVCYMIMLNRSTDIQQWEYPLPLIRGLAGISTGCLLYILKSQCKDVISIKLLNILSIISVVISTLLLFCKTVHCIIPVICYFIIIYACFTTKTILHRLLNQNIFSKWSKISFEIFIGHMFFMSIAFPIIKYAINNHNNLTNLTTNETIIGCIIYTIVLIVAGYTYKTVCNYIQKFLDSIFYNKSL